MNTLLTFYRGLAFIMGGSMLLYGIVVLSSYFEEPSIPIEIYEIAFVAPVFIIGGFLSMVFAGKTIYFPGEVDLEDYMPIVPRGCSKIPYFNGLAIITLLTSFLLIGGMLYFLLILELDGQIRWLCIGLLFFAVLQIKYVQLMKISYQYYFPN